MTTALDLFAGPGGWSQACRDIGIDEVGVEWANDPIETARKAGHRRVAADVRRLDDVDNFDGLIASPPCQTFSQAGRGHGRRTLDIVCDAVAAVAHGQTPRSAVGLDVVRWDDDEALFGMDGIDERTLLVLEPMRVLRMVRPRWVAFEQVPAVLPIWHAYARELTRLRYSVAVGVVNAEQYGVPQTRRRAVLLAADGDVHMPRPTHTRYRANRPQTHVDDGCLPWVSMADALDWDDDDLVGFPRRDDGRDALVLDGVDYRARDLRRAAQPAQTVTEKSRSWLRLNDQSGTSRDARWPFARPATTVAGRAIIADPGANSNRFNGATKSRNDGIRVTPSEAGVLQTFPADYPWSGGISSQHQQIGDAVPPRLARALLRQVAR